MNYSNQCWVYFYYNYYHRRFPSQLTAWFATVIIKSPV